MTEREIFLEALEISTPEARAAYLRGVCAGNVTLHGKVEELLKEHFANDSLLAGPALEGGRSEVESRQAPAQLVGRYKLLEKIGEGGFGEVWMAEQREPVKRRVALKIIKLGMDSRQVVARFEAERQALAMMDHPNIARIFDADTTDTGRPYFVMELVRGIKITEYCDQNQLPTRERLDLFIKVCQAIQHAHQKGIIHRDIKPSNILVTLHDGVPVPKVIDFGIAKATQQELTEKTLFTQFQQFIGTPAYISPEQAEMSGLDIDTRADIYSLGVLLYELLVGQTPFDAKAMMQGGLDALRRIIREKEPLRPSTRLNTLEGEAQTTAGKVRQTEVGKLVHQLQRDLDWIVMKCLEKDRARRYETADGLAMDIERHLNNEPVLARPPSKLYEFQKTVKRHKLGFAAAGAVGLVLVAGILASAWQAVRAMKAEKLANDRLLEAEAISSFMGEVIQSPDPTRDGRTIRVVELLDKAAKNLETELAGQPGRKAKLQARLGTTYDSLGLYREAIPLREKVRDYFLATSGPEHPDTLGAMQNLANSYHEFGRTDEALKLREEVLALRRKMNGPEHLDTLWAMHGLAHSYITFGRNAEAIQLLEVALSLSRKVNGPEHQLTLHLVNCLANQVGHSDEALKMREEALPLSRKVNGPEHRLTLDIMANLANSYAAGGRWDEALKLREEVLTLYRKVLGPEHTDTLAAMRSLAVSYKTAGRSEEARALFEDALKISSKVLGPNHPKTLFSMNWLAWLLATCSDAKLRDGPRAVSLSEQAVAGSHRKNPEILDTLAAAYAETGQFDKAISVQNEAMAVLRSDAGKKSFASRLRLYECKVPYRDLAGGTSLAERKKAAFDWLDLLRARLPADDPQLDGPLVNLTQILVDEQKFAEAEVVARDSLALREKIMPDSWLTFNTRSVLGEILMEQKNYTNAEPFLLSGYDGLKQRQDKLPAAGKVCLSNAVVRATRLYDATGQPEKVAEWKKLLEFDQAKAEK